MAKENQRVLVASPRTQTSGIDFKRAATEVVSLDDYDTARYPQNLGRKTIVDQTGQALSPKPDNGGLTSNDDSRHRAEQHGQTCHACNSKAVSNDLPLSDDSRSQAAPHDQISRASSQTLTNDHLPSDNGENGETKPPTKSHSGDKSEDKANVTRQDDCNEK